MTSSTDTDIRELKDLILGLDKKIESLDRKVDIGFSDIKGEIKHLDTRLVIIESTLTKLANRLWTFARLFLTSTLGALLTIFARYIFSNNPNP